MAAPPSNDLIERISNESNINLSQASVEQRLSVYFLAIQQISDNLQQDMQFLPEDFLQDIKETLNTIRVGLIEIQNQRVAKALDQGIKSVSPFINDAYSSILSALTILEEKGKTSEYYNTLVNLSSIMNEIL